MYNPIRLAVYDEHPLYRQGVVNTIKRASDMTVVAEGKLADAQKAAILTNPDIVLLGIRGDGLDDVREILGRQKQLRVVLLTVSEKEEHLSEAFQAGISGYILKGVTATELIGALEAVHRGEQYITPTLATALVMKKLRPLEPDLVDAAEKDRIHLAPREREVLEHLARGLSRTEIASEMSLSVPSIKHYMTNLFRKIRARNRMEAIRIAQTLHLI